MCTWIWTKKHAFPIRVLICLTKTLKKLEVFYTCHSKVVIWLEVSVSSGHSMRRFWGWLFKKHIFYQPGLAGVAHYVWSARLEKRVIIKSMGWVPLREPAQRNYETWSPSSEIRKLKVEIRNMESEIWNLKTSFWKLESEIWNLVYEIRIPNSQMCTLQPDLCNMKYAFQI